jgi:hypothetical protein
MIQSVDMKAIVKIELANSIAIKALENTLKKESVTKIVDKLGGVAG